MKPSKTIKTLTQASCAERLGRALGWTCRGFMRLEQKTKGWLAAHGMNAALVTGILWALRLVLLGFVLYGAFWVALLLAFAYIGAWIARNDDGSYDEEHESKWEYGPAGYGLYSYDGFRIDPHDPDDEQD
jgi:hypothetical protein